MRSRMAATTRGLVITANPRIAAPRPGQLLGSMSNTKRRRYIRFIDVRSISAMLYSGQL